MHPFSKWPYLLVEHDDLEEGKPSVNNGSPHRHFNKMWQIVGTLTLILASFLAGYKFKAADGRASEAFGSELAWCEYLSALPYNPLKVISTRAYRFANNLEEVRWKLRLQREHEGRAKQRH